MNKTKEYTAMNNEEIAAAIESKGEELREKFSLSFEIMDDLLSASMNGASRSKVLKARKRYDEQFPTVTNELDELSREYCILAGTALLNGIEVDTSLLRAAQQRIHPKR